MKIAVYTIALNEEKFVERWYESCKDADYLLIADTGSTDGTVELARSLGINVVEVSVKPWRFDDARNASLAVIPADIDYCISLDVDEVLAPGWKKAMEEAYENKWTRPRYTYIWSWSDDGTPGHVFGGDKIHTRHGYRWKHPVHEIITPDRIKETTGFIGLQLEHHPDNAKSRGQYLSLLELSVTEDPENDRNAYYYARELFFYQQFEKAAAEFKRHLKLRSAVWEPERASSYRYLAKCEPNLKEQWLLKAKAESPGRREALVELADHYYSIEDWKKCLAFAEEAISIETKPLDFLCEPFAWGSRPWDYAAISAFKLGKQEKAIQYGTKAVELNPTDQRLATNLTYYLKE
jgi:glycosyltransferase involved in cell wall biosynthesis